MLRRANVCLKLKRNKSPYVHKYLEGCPLPNTLIDDLAGANLKSSAPFFTTAPRYILAGAEKRLSRLYFHHTLYPAGGARRPYRAVVVRGGRSVRSQSTDFVSGATTRNPVRRPFFYARPKGTPRASDEGREGRAGGDSALGALCGFVEAHFAGRMRGWEAKRNEEAEGKNKNEKEKSEHQKCLLQEIEALLSGGHGGLTPFEQTHSTGKRSTGSLLTQYLERSVAGSAQESFVYVHAHLPSSAVSRSSDTRDGQTTHLSHSTLSVHAVTQSTVSAQLAGGLEPVASFAVGSPVAVWSAEGKEWMPFAHVQCLLRLSTCRPAEDTASTTNASSSSVCFSNHSSAQSHSSCPVHRESPEPWKLGRSLDPAVPFHVRTVAEAPKTVSQVGRDDCETYVIPQRELLLCLHAPPDVVRQCAAQNEARRRRRESVLGNDSIVPPAFADVPRNAQRVLDGQYRNSISAEEAAQSSSCKAVGNGEGVEYKIRALPGDVVFVPRGWRYSVQRILGVAITQTSPTTAEEKASSLSASFSSPVLRPAFSTVPRERPTVCKSASALGDLPVALTGVDVDAFVLCYKPYPVLSPEQAATYVSANYVQGGVDEFYANGGNSVYHKYV